MYVIRPVSLRDIDALEHCAATSGIGLTHLPNNRLALEEKVYDSMLALSKDISSPVNENYIFVVSDESSNEVGGTCGIYSRTGVSAPFSVFAVELDHEKGSQTLRLKNYVNGPSEVGGLYLLPEYRRGGLGLLLSLSRMLFIASHPKRFDDIVLANMRGIIDEGHSVFWNAIGARYYKMSFKDIIMERSVDELSGILFPQEPITISSLPSEAREVIGKVHPNTKPALAMLEKEGFRYANEIDPFDGGPILKAIKAELRTVKQSIVAVVKTISEKTLEQDKRYMICNGLLDFRVCYSGIEKEDDGSVTISRDVAKALKVSQGDSIRYVG